MRTPTVVFEDKNFLVIHKPSGLNADKDRLGHESVEAWTKNYLGGKEAWLVNRLDRPVSGILMISKKKSFLKVLQANWEQVKKLYIAVVEGKWNYPDEYLLSHFHKKDAKHFRAIVSESSFAGAKACQLQVRFLGYVEDKSVLHVELLTGRYHQIRAQLSAVGHPIVGDSLYGATPSMNLPPNTMLLHAYTLTLPALPPTYTSTQKFFQLPSTAEWERYLLLLHTSLIA